MNLCKGRLKSKSWFQTTFSYKQITPNTPPTSFPPPLPSGGRGLGRGLLYGLHKFDFPSSREATPILTFPRQTGEGTRLLIR